jgi:LacI family transcriptional regulator
VATERVTIRDVARVAGVSVTTVSNALNGRTSTMADETLVRVQETIRSLGYRPSDVARGLVRRRTSTVGLVISEIETPLFLQAVTVVQPRARAVGYGVLTYTARDISEEEEAIELLLQRDVAGVIFLSTSAYARHEHIAALTEAGKPIVLVNRTSGPPGVNRINWDNKAGVAEAVTHLARLGHQRIAHLQGPLHRRSSAERSDGYRNALVNNGLDFTPEYVRTVDYTASQNTWEDATRELLVARPRPTAVMAADDMVAAVAIRTAQRLGLSVPGDLSVVGVDDQPFSRMLNPSLTTVRLPVPEAGNYAIELLLARLSGSRTEPAEVLLSCPLIVRESSSRPAERSEG